MASEKSAHDTTNASAAGRDDQSALTLLASLFFMWGFITVINNTLLPHLRSVFELDYTVTTLIESVWFIAYVLFYALWGASPTGAVPDRVVD